MKDNKYKILVLSDLNKSTNTILKNAISLAKMLDGDVDFFHVKKPSDVVKEDNQLSAIRTINQEHFVTKKKIKNLIDPISKDFGIAINHTFSYGNVKNEIGNYIKTHQPDIIVLGKRYSKTFKLIGDSITQFVLKKHDGVIMIAANNNALEPNKNLSLGVLNGIGKSFECIESLIKHTETPIKSFKIGKNSGDLNEENTFNDKKNIEFVFEKSANTIESLSNYLSENNINLLCVNRENKKTSNKLGLIKSDIKDVINKLDVSLLLSSGKQNFSIQQ